MKQNILELRQRNAQKDIPRLIPYEVNPAIAKMPNQFVGGGPTLDVLWKGFKHRNAHKKNFEVKCRVTGQTGKWRYMKPNQCEQWVKNGDLLVSEAERIIRQHNLKGPNGEVLMLQVYKILEIQGL